MKVYKRREKIPITKYNPKFRNELGHYVKDEWTSISDIGKTYNGKVFTYEKYIEIENLYVEAVFLALNFFKSKSIKITHIFKLSKKKDFKKYNDNDLYNLFTTFENNVLIKDVTLIDQLIRLRLREHIAELEIRIDAKSRTEIIFGFDYYMYINTNKDVIALLKQISNINLFVK